MSSSSTFRSLSGGEDPLRSHVAATPPLLHRLRIGNASASSSSKFCPKKPVKVPFRRRTESVSTVLSTASSTQIESGKSEDIAAMTTATDSQIRSSQSNPLLWLEQECPSDVLPKILAYCGPQQVAALAQTNSTWKQRIVGQEPLWRVLCEELYKWKPGDPEPESWFDFYRYSPCVPIDYSSIPKAMSVAMEPPPPLRTRGRAPPPKPPLHQVRSVRILLRPGTYYLRQAVDIQALAGVVVALETMELPANLYRPPPPPRRPVTNEAIMEQPLPLTPPNGGEASSNKRRPSFHRLFSCHRQESVEETDLEETDFTMAEDWRLDHHHATPKQHATLVLRSRRHNEPVFRVRQGVLHLRHLELQHSSPGLDIWNGNAAVQIQPPLNEDEVPAEVEPRPTVFLQRTHVSSHTGRGIVNIDGGRVVLRQCAVTDCAATGVYIGGGSDALLQRTDVLRNGVGNRVRRGIARGHSGIYLEQGTARIQQCNVSSNTLTGISVVSPDQAFLTLEESSLMNNGTYQLELPPLGTVSRQRAVQRDNQMAVRGEAPMRSGLVVPEPPPHVHELPHAAPLRPVPH